MAWESITRQNIGQLQTVQTATRGWISQLVWSPDGRLLACSSAGGVAVWRGGLNSPPVFIKQHDGPVKGIAFAPNGATFATASADTTVKVWDLRAFSPQMQPVAVFSTGEAGAEKVVIARNGAVIVSDTDGRVWIFYSAERIVPLDGHAEEVGALAVDHQRGWVASGSRDNTVRLWDVRDGAALATLSGHSAWVRGVAFHPAEPLLASASRDGTVRLWDLRDIAQPRQLAAFPHEGDVRAVAIDASGDMVASGSLDGTIQIWDTATHERRAVLMGHTMPVVALAFHPKNHLLASGGGDNAVRLWGTV